MKLKILSDLHTCWWGHRTNKEKFKRILNSVLPPQEHDKDCILLCAGDMGKFHNSYDNSLKILFKELSKRFHKVIAVPGNHEYYQSVGIWNHEEEFWKARTKLPENVYYLDNSFIAYHGVMFIGSCLWTSCDNRNPVAMYHIEKGMNDYNQIKKAEGFRLSAEDTVARHEESVQFLISALRIARQHQLKPVVITHHAPCVQSVNKKYAGDMLNHAFYSDLSEMILDYQPQLWVHGHMHDSVRYKLGETEIICNPFGYIGTMDQNIKFDNDLIVEM